MMKCNPEAAESTFLTSNAQCRDLHGSQRTHPYPQLGTFGRGALDFSHHYTTTEL